VEANAGSSVVGLIGGFIGPVGDVRGLPFSADVVEEREQFLADGNRIHQETHGKLFRDSQGRTRTESEFGGMIASKPVVVIHIIDPVEKTSMTLDVERKIAMVGHFGNLMPSPRETRPLPKPAATNNQQTTARTRNSGGETSSEDLGTKEIEGFTARGTRLVRTIPAGTIGNDKPMTTSIERWYSDDLKVELLLISESPESGRHVHKLVNINSGDPDPLLFQVPADFTVREQPQR